MMEACPIKLPIKATLVFLRDANHDCFARCDTEEQAQWLAFAANAHVATEELQQRAETVMAAGWEKGALLDTIQRKLQAMRAWCDTTDTAPGECIVQIDQIIGEVLGMLQKKASGGQGERQIAAVGS